MTGIGRPRQATLAQKLMWRSSSQPLSLLHQHLPPPSWQIARIWQRELSLSDRPPLFHKNSISIQQPLPLLLDSFAVEILVILLLCDSQEGTANILVHATLRCFDSSRFVIPSAQYLRCHRPLVRDRPKSPQYANELSAERVLIDRMLLVAPLN